MPSAGTETRLDAAVGAIWLRRRDEIVARADTLEEGLAALLAGTLEEKLRAESERSAHKLTGVLGTFGLERGTKLARILEAAFAGSGPRQDEAARLAETLLALRRELERGPGRRGGPTAEPTAAPPPGPLASGEEEEPGPLVLLVSSDTSSSGPLVDAMTGRGLRVRLARGPDAAERAATEEAPDVAIMDFGGGGASDRSLAVVERLSGGDRPIPVITLATRADLVDRVDVARRGARAFLDRTSPPSQVAETVELTLAHVKRVATTVLAVDDDPVVLEALAERLEPQGVDLIGLDDPRRFWDRLAEVGPDLVILDADMPHVGGVELCAVLRADPRFSEVPVLFLTARRDPATVRRIFESGADDYVPKPLAGREIVTRIRNRLERVGLYRRLSDTDPLTSVANRRKSSAEIERYLGLAERYDQPMSIAVIDVDDFKPINDRHGHAAGDALLRRLAAFLSRSFKGEDIVARWGGDEFVLGMYGMTRSDGVARLADVLERFREERVRGEGGEPVGATFTAGIAQYPADGVDLHALYRAADAALYMAKEAGSNRVLPSGWRANRGATADDVILVMDDESVGSTLVDAFGTRGQSVAWLRDADEAVAELTRAAHGRARARLVILDLSVPGPHELALLERLHEEGALNGRRLIVLADPEVDSDAILAARELGARGHISRPVSVPVLMQRVRHVLKSRGGAS